MIGIKGNVLVLVEDMDGRILHRERAQNRVVATGRTAIRNMLLGHGRGPNHIAFGTNSPAVPVSDGNTGLSAETYRLAITDKENFPGIAQFVVRLTEADGNGNTWRELGLFLGTDFSYTSVDPAVPLLGGVLLARAIITPIVKTTLTRVSIRWDVNFYAV
jgi:hypothetical protein